mgnify:CR=1 FL=1
MILRAPLTRPAYTVVDDSYEYAGFLFQIRSDPLGYYAQALPGQHINAHKEKHARAALSCWVSDQSNRRNLP